MAVNRYDSKIGQSKRHGKVSDEEAAVMQVQQAEATIRKLLRKLYNTPEGTYHGFLQQCVWDVQGQMQRAA